LRSGGDLERIACGYLNEADNHMLTDGDAFLIDGMHRREQLRE